MPESKYKNNKNNYFTQEHENAILNYVACQDSRQKEEIYITIIAPVLSEMVDKIVYTFRFNHLPNIETLKCDCKNWLATILDKFDVTKNYKAFAYFSVITKNWFIHQTKINTNHNFREVSLTDIPKQLEKKFFVVHETYLEDKEKKDFWRLLKEDVNNWNVSRLKTDEKKVYDAVKLLLNNVDEIDIFNKKAIYLYLREITGLSTKQIVSTLKILRHNYSDFRKRYNES